MRQSREVHGCLVCGRQSRDGCQVESGGLSFCSVRCCQTWNSLPGHSQAGVLLGRDGPGPAVPPAASPPADRREGFELRLVCSVAGISVFRRLLAGLACLASAAIVFLIFGGAMGPEAGRSAGGREARRQVVRPPALPAVPATGRSPVPVTPLVRAVAGELPPAKAVLPVDPMWKESPGPLEGAGKVAAFLPADAVPPAGVIVEEELEEGGHAIGAGLHGMCRGRADSPLVGLTFDGTWDGRGLGPILNALREKGVRATFFLGGPFIRAYPDLVRRIAAEGHEVGNHLYAHEHLTTFTRNHRHDTAAGLTRARFHYLLEANAALFAQVAGRPMARLWRAPYGETNPEIEAWAAEKGYFHVAWTAGGGHGSSSMDTMDWVSNPASPSYLTPAKICERVAGFDGGRPGGANGALILMHLGSSRTRDFSWEALPAIIDRMRAKGYHFTTAGRLAAGLLEGRSAAARAPAREDGAKGMER